LRESQDGGDAPLGCLHTITIPLTYSFIYFCVHLSSHIGLKKARVSYPLIRYSNPLTIQIHEKS
jgi:hypothetical protein